MLLLILSITCYSFYYTIIIFTIKFHSLYNIETIMSRLGKLMILFNLFQLVKLSMLI